MTANRISQISSLFFLALLPAIALILLSSCSDDGASPPVINRTLKLNISEEVVSADSTFIAIVDENSNSPLQVIFQGKIEGTSHSVKLTETVPERFWILVLAYGSDGQLYFYKKYLYHNQNPLGVTNVLEQVAGDSIPLSFSDIEVVEDASVLCSLLVLPAHVRTVEWIYNDYRQKQPSSNIVVINGFNRYDSLNTLYARLISDSGIIISDTAVIRVRPLHQAVPAQPWPKHKSINIPIHTQLSWSPILRNQGEMPTYSVSIGKTPGNMKPLVSGLILPATEIHHLFDNQQYFWQVTVHKMDTIINGPVWQFTTRPNKEGINNKPLLPAYPSPPLGAAEQAYSNLILSWLVTDPDGDAVTTDVYFDSIFPPTTRIRENITSSTIALPELVPNTVYYWTIHASDSLSTVQGQVWNFKTASLPQLTFVRPIPNEDIEMGQNYELQWAVDETRYSEVILSYAAPGAAEFTVLTTLPSTTSKYSWIAPNTPGQGFQFRLEGVPGDNRSSVAISFNLISAPIAKKVYFIWPQYSAKIEYNNQYEFLWNWTGPVDSLSLQLYNAIAGTVDTLYTGTNAYFRWQPTERLLGTVFQLIVSDLSDPLISDTVDIKIIEPRTLTLLDPVWSELEIGETATISWNATGISDSVDLWYTTDLGSSWQPIDRVLAGSGSYDWLVPDEPVFQTCKISISSLDGLVTDETDSVYSIVSTAVYKDWPYKCEITVNTRHQGFSDESVLADYPLLIRVDKEAFGITWPSTGTGFRYSDPDGNPLAFEVETQEMSVSDQVLNVWVSIPQLRLDTTYHALTMHWGFGDALDTSNGAFVFSNESDGWEGVFHFNSGAYAHNSVYLDEKNLENNNASFDQGYIGGAQKFDGNGDWMEMENPLMESFTVSVWLATLSGKNNPWFFNNNSVVPIVFMTANGWSSKCLPMGILNNKLVFTTGSWDSMYDRQLFSETDINIGEWVHVAVTYQMLDGIKSVYINGILENTETHTLYESFENLEKIVIGRQSEQSYHYEGKLDELRIRTKVVSNTWVLMDYLTQKQQNEVVTFGAIQTK